MKTKLFVAPGAHSVSMPACRRATCLGESGQLRPAPAAVAHRAQTFVRANSARTKSPRSEIRDEKSAPIDPSLRVYSHPLSRRSEARHGPAVVWLLYHESKRQPSRINYMRATACDTDW